MDAPCPPPARPPRPRLAAALAALAALAGCANPGPLAERRTMLGTLRSSVAQLESEKYQLQKQLAAARSEARDLEDRLVQEQAHGEALARRLDDAQRLSRGPSADPFDADPDAFAASPPPARRATPAARPKGRKTPFAQIPGQIQPLPEDDPFGPEPDEPADPFRTPNGYGPQGRRDADPSGWLPIARGLDLSPNRRR